jgi:ADP-ribose pyrophosphatase
VTGLPVVPTPARWIGRRRTVHRNPFGTVYAVRAEFDGFAKDYYVVDFGPRVGVVAVRDGRVLLTAQYRLLVDDVVWEIPGGRVDEGESAAAAAQRECLEETGFLCSDLRPLVRYRPGLDNVENLTTVFYSESVQARRAFAPDPAEVLAVAWLPLTECVSMVLEGQITDSLTMSALLAYRCVSVEGNGTSCA